MLFFASDHAGYDLKKKLVEHYSSSQEVQDCGTDSTESTDYPLFAKKLCDQVLSGGESRGILICGTGVGMSISANKIQGIRAACVSEPQSAQMAREHNNAQVLCVGSRILDEARAKECIDAFLQAQFDSSHPRHSRRLGQIENLEKGRS